MQKIDLTGALVSFQQFARIWVWIAALCCLLSIAFASALVYIEQKTQCLAKSPSVYSADNIHSVLFAFILGAAFMVFFFVRVSSETWVSKINALRNSPWKDFDLISERVPVTGVHVFVHIPLIGFCVLTLTFPGLVFAVLRFSALKCGYL